MLAVNDLINIKYIPTENEISLQLFVDFYEQYLCKKIYIFTLKNGSKVKLFFKDTTEIFHLSGINHIYDGIPMDGTRFIKEVKDKKIDLAILKTINSGAYTDYIDRIRSVACIDSIIKNCEYLWYPDGKIPDSKVKVKYLLLKGMDGKNLHLGIDTYKEGRPFFSRTLLVKEGNSADKYINSADEQIRVAKLEIIEKDTNTVLEVIERDKAISLTDKLISEELSNWQETNLSIMYENFHGNLAEKQYVKEKILNIGLQHEEFIFNEINKKIETAQEILDIQNEFQSAANDKEVWEKFYEDAIMNFMDEQVNISDMLKENILKCNRNEIYSLIVNSIPQFIKHHLALEVKKVLEEAKTKVRFEVDPLDNYWSGKIVAEVIRDTEKKFLKYESEENVKNLVENNKELYINSMIISSIDDITEPMKKRLVGKICRV